MNDLITDVEHARQQERALTRMMHGTAWKGAGVVGVQQGGHVARHRRKKLFEPMPGRQCRLVARKAMHTVPMAEAMQVARYAVPQGRRSGSRCEQVGVQGDDEPSS